MSGFDFFKKAWFWKLFKRNDICWEMYLHLWIDVSETYILGSGTCTQNWKSNQKFGFRCGHWNLISDSGTWMIRSIEINSKAKKAH